MRKILIILLGVLVVVLTSCNANNINNDPINIWKDNMSYKVYYRSESDGLLFILSDSYFEIPPSAISESLNEHEIKGEAIDFLEMYCPTLVGVNKDGNAATYIYENHPWMNDINIKAIQLIENAGVITVSYINLSNNPDNYFDLEFLDHLTSKSTDAIPYYLTIKLPELQRIAKEIDEEWKKKRSSIDYEKLEEDYRGYEEEF